MSIMSKKRLLYYSKKIKKEVKIYTVNRALKSTWTLFLKTCVKRVFYVFYKFQKKHWSFPNHSQLSKLF